MTLGSIRTKKRAREERRDKLKIHIGFIKKGMVKKNRPQSGNPTPSQNKGQLPMPKKIKK